MYALCSGKYSKPHVIIRSSSQINIFQFCFVCVFEWSSCHGCYQSKENPDLHIWLTVFTITQLNGSNFNPFPLTCFICKMLIGYQHMLRIRLYKYEIPRFDFPCYESLIMQYFELFLLQLIKLFLRLHCDFMYEIIHKKKCKSNDLLSNYCNHREYIQ